MVEDVVPTRLAQWEQELQSDGYVVRCYECVGSTMDLARSLAAELPEGGRGLVLARSQEAGRGRQGRRWVPPRVGLYATAVLRSAGSLETLSGLSLAVGVVVAEVLEDFGAAVQIKWPNDILSLGGDKMGGILVETVSSAIPLGGAMATTRRPTVTALVGIGINLAGEPTEVAGTTSLETMSGRSVTPVELARCLAPKVAAGWEEFLRSGFAVFRDRFLARACFVGEEVTLDHGESREQGIFQGVDSAGALQVLLPQGIAVRASGEVKNVRRVGKKE